MTSVAVMQPYLLPYVGYLQLMRAVDTFVWLDDAQFVKHRSSASLVSPDESEL